MAKNTLKKILLAVDGSDRALEVVKYVCRMEPFQKMQTVLFTVRGNIPEQYWDMEKEPPLGWRLREVRAWEREHNKKIQEYMEMARKKLWRAGFPKEFVKVIIHEREKGFARDIITEAKRGYSGVIVGRKGISEVKDLVLGSVSTKLLEKLNFVPIVVVGKAPRWGAVLLALDGSENSMRTVDYVATVFGGSNFDVGLIHVIRGDKKEFVKRAKYEISRIFEQAKTRLVESGFEAGQVSTKIITGVYSRAGAIVEEAKRGNYGTIVVGRRGLSHVQAFFMGRVSNKVVHLAKNHAVWVVS